MIFPPIKQCAGINFASFFINHFMKTAIVFVLTALLVFSCRDKTANTTMANETAKSFDDSLASPELIDSMTAIKNRSDYMRRSDQHKMLSDWEGEWTGTGTLWRSPDTSAVFSEIKSTNKMGMGRRFLILNQTGKLQDSAYESMCILGYDNAKKVFTSSWVDNFGTGLTTLEGSWNDEKNQLELKGKMMDPVVSKEVEAKQIIRLIDANNQFIELYQYPKGKEVKIVEVKFTRDKKENTTHPAGENK
jgi:hypothetical protein